VRVMDPIKDASNELDCEGGWLTRSGKAKEDCTGDASVLGGRSLAELGLGDMEVDAR